jgi:hypothetical protein
MDVRLGKANVTRGRCLASKVAAFRRPLTAASSC